ncbi:glycosyl transferase [Prolixibacter sp. SD074]|nr:glycosyl transferase [Prolixibacter sp. SD074]
MLKIVLLFVNFHVLKKKVVIIGTAWPFRGGLAAYNERLAREFQSAGYEVRIETFTLQYPNFLFPGKTQYADWEAPADINIQATVNSINPLNWLKVGNRIRKEAPDIVIFKYWLPFMAPCFGTIGRRVRKNKKTKVIAIADNIIPHEPRPGDKPFTHFFTKAVDGFVAMSKSVFNDIAKFDRNKPRGLCPHPLFDNFGAPLSREEAIKSLELDPNFRYLLFFGFIRDYKGLDWLLEAFADERLRKFPVRLLVAGEFYSPPDSYLKLIEKLQLNENLILHTDFIADSEVAKYFSVADMIVQPYKSATQSGVTQIGYHFEKPMLVTDVGGLSEIIPDQKVGYVVQPNVKAIADALVDFYENSRQSEFEEQVKEEKKKYSWKRMVGIISEVYQQIV